MKKERLTLLFLTAITSLMAQGWSTKKITGNGNIITQERSISDFHSLQVSGNFEVSFSQDMDNMLELKGDENLLDDIVTKVKDGSLKIKPKKKVYLKPSNKRIKVILPQETLKQISLSGSGKISNDIPFEHPQFEGNVSGSGKVRLHINAANAKFNISGSGVFELYGEAEALEAKLSGSGSFKAKDFRAEKGNLQLSGSGRMEVRCTDKLNAKVSGSGRIRYFGEPKRKLDAKVSGSGSVRKAIE